jgi:hypothetical protein
VLKGEHVERFESLYDGQPLNDKNIKSLCGAFLNLEDSPFMRISSVLQRINTRMEEKNPVIKNKFGGMYLQ